MPIMSVASETSREFTQAINDGTRPGSRCNAPFVRFRRHARANVDVFHLQSDASTSENGMEIGEGVTDIDAALGKGRPRHLPQERHSAVATERRVCGWEPMGLSQKLQSRQLLGGSDFVAAYDSIGRQISLKTQLYNWADDLTPIPTRAHPKLKAARATSREGLSYDLQWFQKTRSRPGLSNLQAVAQCLLEYRTNVRKVRAAPVDAEPQ